MAASLFQNYKQDKNSMYAPYIKKKHSEKKKKKYNIKVGKTQYQISESNMSTKKIDILDKYGNKKIFVCFFLLVLKYFRNLLSVSDNLKKRNKVKQKNIMTWQHKHSKRVKGERK